MGICGLKRVRCLVCGLSRASGGEVSARDKVTVNERGAEGLTC